MSKIQAVKIGNTINVSISGKLYKKVCASLKEANELFQLIIAARANPSEQAIKNVRMALNEKLRTALLAGIEADVDTGEAFLAGFNTPIPETLLEVIKEYHENGYPMDAIINFWKLLMINPDKRIRVDLFKFISTHDFVLTDKGYMVVYKAVNLKKVKEEKKTESTFEEFINKEWLHIKKDWSCSPNKYVAYKNIKTGELAITKYKSAKKWDEKKKGVEIIGKVGDLYSALVKAVNDKEDNEDKALTYTDMYTNTMSINIGVPVLMERTECDSDPTMDCSYGLHVGATKYVESFAGNSSAVLACLVNPANVVAVPQYDHSKMRVSEYFPFAIAKYENRTIDIVEQKYFEDDYCTFEQESLETQLEKLKNDELPIAKAKGAEEEARPMSELIKIIETRIFDIN